MFAWLKHGEARFEESLQQFKDIWCTANDAGFFFVI